MKGMAIVLLNGHFIGFSAGDPDGGLHVNPNAEKQRMEGPDHIPTEPPPEQAVENEAIPPLQSFHLLPTWRTSYWSLLLVNALAASNPKFYHDVILSPLNELQRSAISLLLEFLEKSMKEQTQDFSLIGILWKLGLDGIDPDGKTLAQRLLPAGASHEDVSYYDTLLTMIEMVFINYLQLKEMGKPSPSLAKAVDVLAVIFCAQFDREGLQQDIYRSPRLIEIGKLLTQLRPELMTDKAREALA